MTAILLSNSMSSKFDFYRMFDERVSRCDSNCNHYYVKHIYKDDSLHYTLTCTEHKTLLNVPRSIAERNIADGALVHKYEDRRLTSDDFAVKEVQLDEPKPAQTTAERYAKQKVGKLQNKIKAMDKVKRKLRKKAIRSSQ